MRANPHKNEHERLCALRSFGVLDTSPEHAFDEINELSAEVCDAPICLISFVDENRQWFKSKIGIDVCETPYDQSICAHAVQQNDYLEITDTILDKRTIDNPLCMGEKPLRFYAGAIMRTSSGLPLGTLCVLDYHPRSLTKLQRKTLETHASHIVKLLELHIAIRNEELLRREIDHRVKNSLLSVSALIRLTRMNTNSENIDTAFHTIERQVNAISLLHRELHRKNETETVRLDRFLGNVLSLLQQSAPENVKVVGNFGSISVMPTEATSIAIICSEFVANSVKHAFPETRNGIISIKLSQSSNMDIHLTCCDNGVGERILKKKVVLDPIEKLGTQLIETAASQLGAVIEQGCDRDGYVLNLSFRSNYVTHTVAPLSEVAFVA